MHVLLSYCKVLGVKLLPVGQQIPRKSDKLRVKQRQKTKTRKKIQKKIQLTFKHKKFEFWLILPKKPFR